MDSRRKSAPPYITQVKRAFFLTFLFVLIISTTVYTTTDHYEMTKTVAYNSIFNGSISGMTRKLFDVLKISSTSGGNSSDSNQPMKVVVFNGSIPEMTRKLVGELKNSLTSPNSGNTSNSNQPMKVDVGVSDGHVVNTEFPGMPDPCAEPRRKTGVEDILCMTPPTPSPDFKNPCWYESGTLQCLPYFHLIGTCKSGTSDFFKRIYLHTDIIPNSGIFGKEIWFWSWKRFETQQNGQIKMTLRQFISQFHAKEIEQHVNSNGYHSFITGHGDPMDIWDRFNWPRTPQNDPDAEEPLWTTPYAVRHINPAVKLLLMLRDPLERLYSHYFHGGFGHTAQSFHNDIVVSLSEWKKCRDKHSLRSCIYSPDTRKKMKAPIYASMYSVHVMEWLKVFPRSQLLIFRNEDYAKDMTTTLRNVFTFLNTSIPDDNTMAQMQNLPQFYGTVKKAQAGPMKKETKDLLVDLYRPFNKDLAKLLSDENYLWKDGSFS